MAKPLPRQIYRIVEGKLHNEKSMRDTIQRGRSDILAAGPSRDSGTPSGHSKHSDPTACKGILLSDGTREMQRAARWLEAIAETRAYFANLPEEHVLNGFYGRKVNAKGYTERYNISRAYLSALRDNVVNHCAFQAISRGLVRLDNFAEHERIFAGGLDSGKNPKQTTRREIDCD